MNSLIIVNVHDEISDSLTVICSFGKAKEIPLVRSYISISTSNFQFPISNRISISIPIAAIAAVYPLSSSFLKPSHSPS
jgi:hypothetical protein